jgi:hypothetical protein
MKPTLLKPLLWTVGLPVLLASTLSLADDRDELPDFISLGQTEFCQQKTAPACQEFAKFKSAKAPHLAAGRGFTVGKMYLGSASKEGQAADQPLSQALFFEAKGKDVKVSAQALRVDSPQEAADTADYIKALYKKQRPAKSSTHDFLTRQLAEVELYPVAVAADVWTYHDAKSGFGNGLAFVRQLHNELLILRLAAVPKAPGSFDTAASLTLSVLPVPF